MERNKQKKRKNELGEGRRTTRDADGQREIYR